MQVFLKDLIREIPSSARWTVCAGRKPIAAARGLTGEILSLRPDGDHGRARMAATDKNRTSRRTGSCASPCAVQPPACSSPLKTSREFSEGFAVREGNRVGNVSRQFPQIGLSDMRKRHFCGGNGVVNRCGGGNAGEAETVPPSNQIF